MKFSNLAGFEKVVDGTITKYYLNDFDLNQILIFNDNWEYIGTKVFTIGATIIKNIGSEVLIVTNPNLPAQTTLYKMDKSLNIVKSLTTSFMSSYLDSWYDQTKDLVYLISHNNQRIDVYDRNLSLIKTISVTGHYPKSIMGYKTTLYIGTLAGHVLVIENDRIMSSFKVCTGYYVYNIHIDTNGNIAVSCYMDQLIKLYTVSGLNLDLSKRITYPPTFFDIDSKGRLVVLTSNEIGIYF